MTTRLLFILGLAALLLLCGAGYYFQLGDNINEIIIVIIFVVAIAALLLMKRKKNLPESDSHGSARWADKNDLKPFLADPEQPPAIGSLVLGPSPLSEHRLDLPGNLMLCHTVMVGPSGIGKGRGFFLHQLALFRGSFLYSDPKSEGWKLTSGFRRNPRRYAPTDPDNSEPFNWIPLCGDDPTLCRLLAQAVVSSRYEGGDLFFMENQTIILAAIFAHASTFDAPTPAAAFDFARSYAGEDLLKQLKASPNQHARGFATIFSNAGENLRGNIIMGAATTLSFLADPRVRRFTSSTNTPPDFSELRKKDISVYWCLSESEVAALKPLSTLFFTLALYQVKQGDLEFSYDIFKQDEIPADGSTKTALPVCLFLDEIANIGAIPGLGTEIAVIRGRGIGVVLGVQTIPQMAKIYGKEEAETILNNCSNKIFLAGMDTESAEYVSNSLGDTTVVEEQESQSVSGNMWDRKKTKTTGLKMHARPLMTGDEVRRMSERRQIIISRNNRPMLTDRFWYEAPANTAESRSLEEAQTIDFNGTGKVKVERVERKETEQKTAAEQSTNAATADTTANNAANYTSAGASTSGSAQTLQPAVAAQTPITRDSERASNGNGAIKLVESGQPAQPAQPAQRIKCSELTVEIIPAKAAVKELRDHVSKEDWNKLKQEAGKNAKYCCEICGSKGSQWPVEVHERWLFDDNSSTQKLLGLIALCPGCHQVKHITSDIQGEQREEVIAHLMKVNGWSKGTTSLQLGKAIRQADKLAEKTWKVDVCWLTEQGVTFYVNPALKKLEEKPVASSASSSAA